MKYALSFLFAAVLGLSFGTVPATAGTPTLSPTGHLYTVANDAQFKAKYEACKTRLSNVLDYVVKPKFQGKDANAILQGIRSAPKLSVSERRIITQIADVYLKNGLAMISVAGWTMMDCLREPKSKDGFGLPWKEYGLAVRVCDATGKWAYHAGKERDLGVSRAEFTTRYVEKLPPEARKIPNLALDYAYKVEPKTKPATLQGHVFRDCMDAMTHGTPRR